MRKFFRALTLGAAVLATLAPLQASAALIDFDNALDTSAVLFPPFLVHGDGLVQGDYFVGTVSTKAGAGPADLVGALIDGNDVANTCSGVKCPTNNGTQFLGMLNDGLPYVGRLDGRGFFIKSFDAGFIASNLDTVPATAMLLRVYGFTADGGQFFEDALLPGPVNGAYRFDTYTLSDAFAAMQFTEVDFYGYACNAAGSCNRSSDKAQFALDNITVEVPEPASLALVGLALAGMASLRRRTQAQA